MNNLKRDERGILAVMDEITGRYAIGKRDVLLTGFLEGGYALYYVGLRNAGRIGMLIARDCYCDTKVLEQIELTGPAAKDARNLPILIFNGKDGLWTLADQSWRAYGYLRKNGYFLTERKELRGGPLRRPEGACEYWLKQRSKVK